jgi:DNA-binding response OmpR family regulator
MRIALLENDPSVANALIDWFKCAGHCCIWHARRQSLMHALMQETFDALVLDGGSPNCAGKEVLNHVRGELRSSLPILFISTGQEENDVVTLLNDGADDCIKKPVRRMELLARLDAITRRVSMESGLHSQVIDVGALRIDCQTRTAQFHDRPIELTAKDFDLSVLFLCNVGRLLPRASLLEAVWGPAAVSSRTLDTHVSRIRDRLRLTPSHGWRLTAVYGHGYRLERAEASAGKASTGTPFAAITS